MMCRKSCNYHQPGTLVNCCDDFLQPRFVVNRVTAGDYDCPKRVLGFLTDLHASFRMLNLRNDFLRKKFDGMKYDLRRVEEVYYDVKIRGLVPA
ncbi:Translin family protein [Zea mays]|uniref:Translin family protein n=1 Tax=Zea mays TaxID=4577 RepID=A0A1D6GQ33_MAIZE|nr:Translin family protein [Zea mays]